MQIKTVISALFLSLALATSAAAGPFEDGLAAADSGDFVTAKRLWRPLAAQNYAAAQHNLGVLYYQGYGVPQDYGEAARWYRLAAEQGYSGAQYNLGLMYAKGEGVPQDDAKALSLHRVAADKGNANAQFSLGFYYAQGESVPQDYVLAHKWFNLAAAQGRESARENRDSIAERMTPTQIAEAQSLAREWRSK